MKSQIMYGICKIPNIKDILKNNIVIKITVIKSKTQIVKAAPIFLYLKNTGIQLIFNKNCKQNKGVAKILLKLKG